MKWLSPSLRQVVLPGPVSILTLRLCEDRLYLPGRKAE